MKRVLLLHFTIVLLIAQSRAQTTITIGTGTATQRFPLGNYYGYERSASLYTSGEIGLAGTVNTIAWFSTVAQAQSRPLRIYLKETTAVVINSDTWANLIAGASLVFDSASGPIAANAWKTFTLSSPFSYSSDVNLLVLVEANYGGTGIGTTMGSSVRYTLSGSRHATWVADITPPTGTGIVNANRPNLQLSITGFPMTYDSSVVTQVSSTIPLNAAKQVIIGIQIATTGTANPLVATQFHLNSVPSDTNDLANARLYYSGTSPDFYPSGQFGPTIPSPRDSFIISGSQALAEGTNYFWLTFDIRASTPRGHHIDAQCTKIVVSGVERVPTIVAPAGSRYVDSLHVQIPYSQSFDAFWFSLNAVRDVPERHWITTPWFGNRSWRRHNDGAAAGWTSPSDGIVPLNGVVGAANFHSSRSPVGSKGTLDLLADCRAAGRKNLAFQYHNANGSDSLRVFFSTDGGATFGPALTTLGTSTSWSSQLISLDTTTSTGCVIRFEATADSGASDIGIDNLSVTLDAPMTYVSSLVVQDSTNTVRGAVNQKVLGIQVNTAGVLYPFALTSLTVTTIGTTDYADITNLRIYYSGTSNKFAPVNQFGTTIAFPQDTLTVSGSQLLASGTNYVWLTYDITASATYGNVVDAECLELVIDGVNRLPASPSPSGARRIAAPMVGDYAIGLTLFNRVSGKNLYTEKRTRRVLKTQGPPRFKNFYSAQRAHDARYALAYAQRSAEVTEEYSVLMERGAPYTGFQSIAVGDAQRTVIRGGDVYATVSAAVADLQQRGVSGPVRFVLMDSIYATESLPITIGAINGSSPINVVTFKPAAGVSPTVIGASTFGLFSLVNADNIVFDGSHSEGGSTRNLTVVNTDGPTFSLSAGSSRDTIKNCVLVGSPSQYVVELLGADNDSVLIENNAITTGGGGIGVFGFEGGEIADLTIANNSIGSNDSSSRIGQVGIEMENVGNSNIVHNTIFNLIGEIPNPTGILLASAVRNSTLRSNWIYDIRFTGLFGFGGKGIDLNTSLLASNITLVNNMVADISGDGWTDVTDGIVGIRIRSGTGGLKLFYNSISLSDTIVREAATNDISAALAVGTESDSLDIKNNIIVNGIWNTGGIATAYGVYCEAPNSVFAASDYNNYFVSGPQSEMGFLGSVRSNLAAWRNATLKDRFSVSGKPPFLSAGDLRINAADSICWNVNGRALTGSASLSTATDIDGDARSTTLGTPADIGADEFSPNVGVEPPIMQQLVSGDTTWFNSAERTVAMVVQESGTLPSLRGKYYPGASAPAAPGVNIKSYWNIERTSLDSIFAYKLRLLYSDAEKDTIAHVVMKIRKQNPPQAWTSLGGSLPSVLESDRYVEAAGLTSFSNFTITDGTNCKASLKLIVEGPYNAVNGTMNNTLKTGGHLLAHFGSIPIPANAVDSINIEMRDQQSALNSTIRKFRPAWLLRDGTIRDFDDTTKSYVEFDAPAGNFYLVARHRNHLGVMTAAAQSLTAAVPSAPYDFTTAQTQAFGANPMKALSDGKFALIAGDANQSNIVTAADANLIVGQLNATGYNIRDANLSGIITAADANMAIGNLNRASQIP
jgi:hypothetical protein